VIDLDLADTDHDAQNLEIASFEGHVGVQAGSALLDVSEVKASRCWRWPACAGIVGALEARVAACWAEYRCR
jgi:hypothetical protein